MPAELPHTHGCVVCGRDNPHGLQLNLYVDPASGVVSAGFAIKPEHIGFEGIAHGGLLATVLDEAMVWAATWAGRRFCVCGELNVRFRQSAHVGSKVTVEARVSSSRSRLIETTGEIRDDRGIVLASGEGKYVPVPVERNRQVVASLVPGESTAEAAHVLREAARAPD